MGCCKKSTFFSLELENGSCEIWGLICWSWNIMPYNWSHLFRKFVRIIWSSSECWLSFIQRSKSYHLKIWISHWRAWFSFHHTWNLVLMLLCRSDACNFLRCFTCSFSCSIFILSTLIVGAFRNGGWAKGETLTMKRSKICLKSHCMLTFIYLVPSSELLHGNNPPTWLFI